MKALWTLPEMLAATGARPVGSLPNGVTGISIDTRSLLPGEAFFAIKGDQFDGHDFVSEAVKAGAGLAFVSEHKLVALGRIRIPLLVVSDVLGALEHLAAAARARTRAQIVAITGSAGKTSTKEMLRIVLSESGRVHASAASFNNHWGVPLSLACMPADTQFGLFEIGMNHAGEIRPLTRMVRPHIGLITNIGEAHIGSFADVGEIARAKSEIFEGVMRRGSAVIPRDSKFYKLVGELASKSGIRDIRSFGFKRGADFRVTAAEYGPDSSTVRAKIAGTRVSFTVPQSGEHIVSNALAVLGVVSLVGADVAISAKALAKAKPVRGRGERFQVRTRRGAITVIDESYNANPASMAAALKTLHRTLPRGRGRRIAVLGDMLELGEQSQKLHLQLKEPITDSGSDRVYLAGPEMAHLAGELAPSVPAEHFADAGQLADALIEALRSGDVIMIKASNGLKFSTIVNRLRAEASASKAEVSKS
jgi:UDP-N-acetylmuramoyl-tripeptide--D-alanyl-D-alanine ligase